MLNPSLSMFSRKYLFLLSDEMNTLLHGSKVERHVIVVLYDKKRFVLPSEGRKEQEKLFRRFFYAITP
jgi:hypothetical protein